MSEPAGVHGDGSVPASLFGGSAAGLPPPAERNAVAEGRVARGGLAAVLSALREQAGELWCGAAAACRPDVDGGEPVDRFELLAVLSAPLHDLAAHERRLRRAAEAAARSRRVKVKLEVASPESLRFLPATLENLACLAAGSVVDGPPDLLANARPTAAGVPLEEGLRLLVRAGGRLLSAGHELDQTGDGQAVKRALFAAREADVSCADAVLIAAGRYATAEDEREAALRGLAANGDGDADGIHRRMSWTRFHDLVESFRRARAERAAAAETGTTEQIGEARKRLAHATDRWLETLRLFEEQRLGGEIASWSDYACRLAARHTPRTGSLFELLAPEAEGPSRRDARRWPAAERLSPAVASLLDWNPADLPLAPVLLDLPEDAYREALVARAAALADDA